jgi:hypothetical protein
MKASSNDDLNDRASSDVANEPPFDDRVPPTLASGHAHRAISERDLAILVQQGEGTTLEYKENPLEGHDRGHVVGHERGHDLDRRVVHGTAERTDSPLSDAELAILR